MKFTMPKASKKSLEKLLEYLGDTKNYSEYYSGNRAEDFKKCFDIESPWCWKYADLMLRGLKKRKLGYKEGHHGIPRAFYGAKRCSPEVDSGNWFVLSYGEHLWAHYLLAQCATGKTQGKMARAFITMYSIGICKKRPLMPSEYEVLDAIPDMELRRIRAMEPQWAKVEAEGRTHKSEDPKQYEKDYREANKERITEKEKAYREANKEKIAEYKKAYREANKEKISENNKAYYEANKEKFLEHCKSYREANKEKRAEYDKAWRAVNWDKIAEYKKAYREANKERITEKEKAYREANKEKIAEYKKAYREANKEKIAENNKAYYEANKERITEYHKAYHEAHKEKILERVKAWCEAKKAAGYRRRKNPITGKHEWVFVDLP